MTNVQSAGYRLRWGFACNATRIRHKGANNLHDHVDPFSVRMFGLAQFGNVSLCKRHLSLTLFCAQRQLSWNILLGLSAQNLSK
jgi:hypothetical protein